LISTIATIKCLDNFMMKVMLLELPKLRIESKKLLPIEVNILTLLRVSHLPPMTCKMYIFKLKLRREKNITSPSTLKARLEISPITLKPEDHSEPLNERKNICLLKSEIFKSIHYLKAINQKP
jgi:hypothetical protein